ncbi:MAG: DnaB-like helicase C-terminal domain-containing protein [Hyphomicrobium sp.]|jgi:replicative DNA helicase
MNAPYVNDSIVSIEAERGIVGAILLDNSVFDSAGEKLKPEYFYSELCKAVYTEIIKQMNTVKQCDVVTVGMALRDLEMSDISALAQHVPRPYLIRRYCEIVIERSKSRLLAAVSNEITELSQDHTRTIEDRVDAAQSQLSKLIDEAPRDDWVSAFDGLVQHTQILEDRNSGKIKAWGTGLSDLDSYLEGGLRAGELVIVGARPSMGKAQPLNAKVLAADGWAEMGGLKVGDTLASLDGQPSIVTGVFPQGEKQVFRVTFSDGRATECCDEHLWSVNYRKWTTPKVLSTSEIRQLMESPEMNGRLWIDTPTGDFGCETSLPVDPWLLGALLGDGDLTQKTISFSKTADQILNLVRDSLPDAVRLVHAGGCDWRLSADRGRDAPGTWAANSNPLTNAVRDLGLMGCSSAAKFIPEIYMMAGRDARMGVLRGLMDTDGWVEKHGSVLFSSASQQLAKDVQALARSLGYWCSMREKATGYKKNGEYHPCLTAYVLTISGKDVHELFLFDGKKDRCATRTRVKRVAFSKIEASREAPCQCISVSHPTHLYITDDYVVTHNTALGMTIGLHLAEQHAVGLLSMEMTHSDVRDRMVAMMGNVTLSNVKRPDTGLQWDRVTESVERSRNIRFAVSDQSGLNINQVRSKARAIKRTQGLNVLVVDYIGLMTGLDPKQNRAYQLEEVSRGLKNLAKELGIAVLCLAQLNRGIEGRGAAAIPQLSDLRDSGAIEQDADIVLFVHRPIQANPELGIEWQSFSKLSIAKNRNGMCGLVYLNYQGNKTKFYGWTGQLPQKSTSSKRGDL